jgi:hypothetical protein
MGRVYAHEAYEAKQICFFGYVARPLCVRVRARVSVCACVCMCTPSRASTWRR